MNITTGLGVDEREHPGGRKRELARIDDLYTQHLMAEREPGNCLGPLGVVQEVGDDDDLAAPWAGTLE